MNNYYSKNELNFFLKNQNETLKLFKGVKSICVQDRFGKVGMYLAEYGIENVSFEVKEDLIKELKFESKNSDFENSPKFYKQSIFEADFSKAKIELIVIDSKLGDDKEFQEKFQIHLKNILVQKPTLFLVENFEIETNKINDLWEIERKKWLINSNNFINNKKYSIDKNFVLKFCASEVNINKN
jgi:hypothetical protein